jgi:NADPH:quinone reductase-like Zn-dependent oxidoreductase
MSNTNLTGSLLCRALLTALSFLPLSGAALAGSPEPAATARKVILEPAGEGYRWALTRAAIPTPGAGQVLIRVHAVSLNHGDLTMLKPDPGESHSGLVPCSDAAGEVIAVSAGVREVRPGARVTSTYFTGWKDGAFSRRYLDGGRGWTADGVLADYIVLDEASVVPIPDGLSYEEAATLPTAALTAWNALAPVRDAREHTTVLVQGTGGVSSFALQFAAALGAQVIVTSSSDAKLDRAKSSGASAVINYRAVPDWSARLLDLTRGHGADLVVDIGGKSTLEQSAASLADGGSIALVGGLGGYDGSIPAWDLIERGGAARGVFVGSRAHFMAMNAFIAAHRLHPPIERVYPLSHFEEALRALASGDLMGKLVLTLE